MLIETRHVYSPRIIISLQYAPSVVKYAKNLEKPTASINFSKICEINFSRSKVKTYLWKHIFEGGSWLFWQLSSGIDNFHSSSASSFWGWVLLLPLVVSYDCGFYFLRIAYYVNTVMIVFEWYGALILMILWIGVNILLSTHVPF